MFLFLYRMYGTMTNNTIRMTATTAMLLTAGIVYLFQKAARYTGQTSAQVLIKVDFLQFLETLEFEPSLWFKLHPLLSDIPYSLEVREVCTFSTA